MNVDRISMVMRTTPVEPMISSRVDHVTFCISARTSARNFLILPSILDFSDSAVSFDLQARRDSNPQQAVLETAALANWSYWPKNAFFNK